MQCDNCPQPLEIAETAFLPEVVDWNGGGGWTPETVEKAVKALAVRAHEKELELNCRVATGLPEILVGDPSRLRQVIVNLAGNAIKFTNTGEVTITVEEESSQRGKISLHFAVQDTGIGIPQHKQDHIFEAFTQADGSTSRRFGGSGLGLTISRRLVEMMGGRIWVESVEHRGSTFHFTAKLGIGHASNLRISTKYADLEGMRVLVVDDNATNRRILQEPLLGWHLRPTLAADAPTAFDCFQRQADSGMSFPLLMVDVAMPEIDGFTLVEQIRGTAGGIFPKIMMLTSATQRGDSARCRDLGISAYLTKPVGKSELFNAIMQIFAVGSEDRAAASVVAPENLSTGKKSLQILLVEDNRVNQLVALRVLEKNGHRVQTAHDGWDALQKMKTECFDVILMDVQMPIMDGFEATAAIREIEKITGGHVPIIAMTAHALKGDRERCLAAGMDGYISKPTKAVELLGEVQRVQQRAGVAHAVEADAPTVP